MTRKPTARTITASLIGMTGLASLSPVQLAVVGVAAIGVPSPALAQTGIPGIGVVVKHKPGNAPIIVPSDASGNTVLTGLEPGTYSVQVFGGTQESEMAVGPDGRLAFVSLQDASVARDRARKPAAPRHPPALPVVRRWAEQLRTAPADSPEITPATPNLIDLNTASAEALVNGTNNDWKAANLIIAERARNGAFTGVEDFAARICPTTDVDFAQQSLRIGEVTVLVRLVFEDTAAPGLQCTRADAGQFSLYGKKHNYVGHVTLLR